MDGLTTRQVSELSGLSPAAVRKAMTRERQAGRDCRLPEELWPDRRTPLYDRSLIEAWMRRTDAETRGRPRG